MSVSSAFAALIDGSYDLVFTSVINDFDSSDASSIVGISGS